VPNEKLLAYIRTAFAQGYKPEDIESRLLAAGYTKEAAHEAVAAVNVFAAVPTSTPPPALSSTSRKWPMILLVVVGLLALAAVAITLLVPTFFSDILAKTAVGKSSPPVQTAPTAVECQSVECLHSAVQNCQQARFINSTIKSGDGFSINTSLTLAIGGMKDGLCEFVVDQSVEYSTDPARAAAAGITFAEAQEQMQFSKAMFAPFVDFMDVTCMFTTQELAQTLRDFSPDSGVWVKNHVTKDKCVGPLTELISVACADLPSKLDTCEPYECTGKDPMTYLIANKPTTLRIVGMSGEVCSFSQEGIMGMDCSLNESARLAYAAYMRAYLSADSKQFSSSIDVGSGGQNSTQLIDDKEVYNPVLDAVVVGACNYTGNFD
jgi:hypothetical protein